jgi:hypothetical protein
VFRTGVIVVGGLDASEDWPVDLDLVVRVGLLGGVLVGAATLAVNRSLKLFEFVGVNNLKRDINVLLNKLNSYSEREG